MLNWYFLNWYVFKIPQIISLKYFISSHFVFYTSIFISFIFLYYFLNKKTLLNNFFLFLTFSHQTFYHPMFVGKVNLGLINPLSIWHPLLLTMSLLFFVNSWLFLYKTLYTSLFIAFWFIILGSWWSSQELLWLGWWNWDGVENSLLIYLIFLFFLTHKNFKWLKLELFWVFLGIFFVFLNKTNIFKSIHSFTSSSASNIPYLIYIGIIVFFIINLYKSKLTFLAHYFSVIWFLFTVYLLFNNSIIFNNLNFFKIINIFFFYFFLLFCSFWPKFIICFLLLFGFKLSLFAVLSWSLCFKKIKFLYKFHIFNFFIYFGVIHILLTECPTFFTFEVNVKDLIRDVVFFNNTIQLQNIFHTNVFYVDKAALTQIHTNINIHSLSCFFDYVNTYKIINKNHRFVIFYFNFIFLFKVTSVFYLKQKPKYNYYNIMYLFKSDLLVNQQKNRKVPDRLPKFHWYTKSKFSKILNLFFITYYLTVDLRLYKLLLRKLKKKLLKYKVSSFVYIIPNNKKSYKTKNSRMGKGKGLNNRFYFRCKKMKPVLIFNQLSYTRFQKLKIFLSKFFNYKYL